MMFSYFSEMNKHPSAFTKATTPPDCIRDIELVLPKRKILVKDTLYQCKELVKFFTFREGVVSDRNIFHYNRENTS